MLFLGVESVFGCSVHRLLFSYGIGIFEVALELVCIIGLELELI